MSRVIKLAIVAVGVVLALSAAAIAAIPGADVRLSRDDPADAGGGYVSNYTAVTGQPYSDATMPGVLAVARPPERAIGGRRPARYRRDPRHRRTTTAASTTTTARTGAPLAVGPIWLGYYRSEDGRQGASPARSCPGIPATRPRTRAVPTSARPSSGDPVIAWDNFGNAYSGPRAAMTRPGPSRRSATCGSGGTTNPNGADRLHDAERRQGVQRYGTSWRRARRRRSCWASSTTRPRSRPTAATCRPSDGQRLLRVLPLHRQRRRLIDLLLPLHRPRPYLGRTPSSARSIPTCSSPTSRSQGTDTSTWFRGSRARRDVRRHGRLRSVDRLRGDVLEAADRRELHPELGLGHPGPAGCRVRPTRPTTSARVKGRGPRPATRVTAAASTTTARRATRSSAGIRRCGRPLIRTGRTSSSTWCTTRASPTP